MRDIGAGGQKAVKTPGFRDGRHLIGKAPETGQ